MKSSALPIAQLGLVMAALVLTSAAPRVDPLDLVRKGNIAFERQEYEAAVKFYTEAEERTTNPGLVAHNKAAAYYKLGSYHEAQLHYRRALEGADGPHRARLLYDLGNSLLRESGGKNAALIQEAIDSYARCLDDADAGLRPDARRNLELAKLLWLKVKPAASNPNKQNGSDPPPPGPDPRQNPPLPGGIDQSPGATADPGTARGTPAGLRPESTPIPTAATQAGSGTSPRQPEDNSELKPMLPEEAALLLQRAADKIRSERKVHEDRMTPPPHRTVKDY